MRGKLSAQALRILAEEFGVPTTRTRENLPQLRADTRAYIAPAVERVLAQTGARADEAEIAGIECLIVTPAELKCDWPILYGYGGGFVQGSPFEDLTIAAPISTATGAKVIMPNYRLAPEHPWPAAIDDGFAVYREMSKTPFAIVGESAGGNFALCLMLRANASGLRLPQVAALLSPWCDLTNSSDSQSFNDGRDPTLASSDSFSAAAHYAGDHDVMDPTISPLFGTYGPEFPPCLITTGTRDLLMSHAVNMSRVLRESGVEVDLQVWEGLWHVFEWDDRLPEAHASLSNIAMFLHKHMQL